MPDGVGADEAETLIVNAVTAYQMLAHRTAKVQAGQTVLVLGASGGVGTILVQLARHAGARVIGADSPRHHDALRALGVEPVDYRDPDLAARVRELARAGWTPCSTTLAGRASPALPAAQPHRHPGLLRRREQARRHHARAARPPAAAREAGVLELPADPEARELLQRLGGRGEGGLDQRHVPHPGPCQNLEHLFGLLRDGVLTAKIAARYPLAEVAAAMELAESSGRTSLGEVFILVP